jgi:hypothetical protein
MDFVSYARKALVPIVVSGVAVVLEAIGVDLPADQVEQIAVGLVNSVFVYLVVND